MQPGENCASELIPLTAEVSEKTSPLMNTSPICQQPVPTAIDKNVTGVLTSVTQPAPLPITEPVEVTICQQPVPTSIDKNLTVVPTNVTQPVPLPITEPVAITQPAGVIQPMALAVPAIQPQFAGSTPIIMQPQPVAAPVAPLAPIVCTSQFKMNRCIECTIFNSLK